MEVILLKRKELQKLIIEEKKKNGTLILAHTYQAPEIIDIADVAGDSYALSVAATKYDAKRVILCGVRFMAETVKILSPEKQVILPKPHATCPMAIQIAPERVAAFKKENPNTAVVAYINTTAELKAECDVCVTSSTAVKIVSAIPQKDILFIPDQNLGAYVQSKLPDKNITLWNGCCPIHHSITAADIQNEKEKHPNAKVAVHPECRPEVLALADMIGSTSAIIDYALKNKDSEIIIGTERGVVDYLSLKHPKRKLYQLRADKLTCPNMKMTTLEDVYNALVGKGGAEITMDENLRLAAKRSIDNMLRYGG